MVKSREILSSLRINESQVIRNLTKRNQRLIANIKSQDVLEKKKKFEFIKQKEK